MNKAFIPGFFLLISLTGFMNCVGQVTDEQHLTKLAALKTDTAFKRFQSEFNAIMKTANKSNSNFASIKKLFTTNRMLLNSLRTKYKLQKRSLIAPKSSVGISKIGQALFSKIVEKDTFTSPYTAIELHPNQNNAPVQISPDDQGGKLIWTTTSSPGNHKYLSPYINSFKQTINVPANPVIVAVRLKFYYAYFLTGWDSEEGVFSTTMRISASPGFNSPAYNEMDINNQTPELMNWRTLPSTYYYQKFEEMHDYTKTKDATFEIEGYVVPGTTLDFKFALVHHPGSYTGDFGAYHYAEYQLKKIEVTYLKAGN